jgi:hypothetical protein
MAMHMVNKSMSETIIALLEAKGHLEAGFNKMASWVPIGITILVDLALTTSAVGPW